MSIRASLSARRCFLSCGACCGEVLRLPRQFCVCHKLMSGTSARALSLYRRILRAARNWPGAQEVRPCHALKGMAATVSMAAICWHESTPSPLARDDHRKRTTLGKKQLPNFESGQAPQSRS